MDKMFIGLMLDAIVGAMMFILASICIYIIIDPFFSWEYAPLWLMACGGGFFGMVECVTSFCGRRIIKIKGWRTRPEIEGDLNNLLERVEALEGGVKE